MTIGTSRAGSRSTQSRSSAACSRWAWRDAARWRSWVCCLGARGPASPGANTLDGVADQAHIRNFSIIAHIDHGKSTLADRILELTHTVDPRLMRAEVLGESAEGVRRISAKTGEGVTDVLDELIARVPPPRGDPAAPPRALIFDSEFDQYRGVIAYIRVVDGTFSKGEAVVAMQAGTRAEIDDIGFFTPQMTSAASLGPGE